MTYKICGTINGDACLPVILCLVADNEAEAKRFALNFEPRMKITMVKVVDITKSGVFGAFYMGHIDQYV